MTCKMCSRPSQAREAATPSAAATTAEELPKFMVTGSLEEPAGTAQKLEKFISTYS